MSKLLIFILVLIGIYLVRRALTKPPASRPPGEPAAPAAPRVERMVECAHCGLHVPESEAISGEGLAHFCCEAHRKAHRSQG
jgi:uncharacterized protein